MPQINSKEIIDLLPEIKCNVCYHRMKLVPYDCGLFIEPCEYCEKEKQKELEIISYDTGYDEGYNAGYDEGYDEGCNIPE